MISNHRTELFLQFLLCCDGKYISISNISFAKFLFVNRRIIPQTPNRFHSLNKISSNNRFPFLPSDVLTTEKQDRNGRLNRKKR